MEIKELRALIGIDIENYGMPNDDDFVLYEEEFYNYNYDYLKHMQLVYVLSFGNLLTTLQWFNQYGMDIFNRAVDYAETLKKYWKEVLGPGEELVPPLTPSELKMYRGILTSGTRYTNLSSTETENLLNDLGAKYMKFVNQMHRIFDVFWQYEILNYNEDSNRL